MFFANKVVSLSDLKLKILNYEKNLNYYRYKMLSLQRYKEKATVIVPKMTAALIVLMTLLQQGASWNASIITVLVPRGFRQQRSNRFYGYNRHTKGRYTSFLSCRKPFVHGIR